MTLQWPYSGYTCPTCGAWVAAGTYHWCGVGGGISNTYGWTPAIDYDKLADVIAEKLLVRGLVRRRVAWLSEFQSSRDLGCEE